MKLMTIASGSSGNSTYIGTDKTSILLDVGISLRGIDKGLKNADLSVRDIDAIFITHEHIDHIKSLGVIARKHNIPIYATYGTIDGILTTRSMGDFDYNLLKPIKNNGSMIIGDITVNACPISHDANDPVCYNFLSNSKKVSVATDMGVYNNMIIDFLSESDAAVIETNHDIRMLEAGPYPYAVKKRIMGERGHLCNEDGAKLIRDILSDHIKYIALGHLSDKNNYADLAFETVKSELEDNPFSNDVRDFGLCVAPRYETGELIEI